MPRSLLGLVVGFVILQRQPGSARRRSGADLARRDHQRRPAGRDVHGLRRPACGWPLRSSARWSTSAAAGCCAIARLSVIESNRRMWAPWVVITVFLVILAFTHWFLQPPRPAEMGRLFVGTLTLLCSLLLTVMVTILTPLSPAPGHPEPDDLHRRLEAGAADRADLGPDDRLHGDRDGAGARLRRDQPGLPLADRRRDDHGDRGSGRERGRSGQPGQGEPASRAGRAAPDRGWRPGCRSRGRLTFLDSRGTPHLTGIDVGQEQSSARAAEPHRGGDAGDRDLELRGRPRPVRPARSLLDRRIPVADLLPRGHDRGPARPVATTSSSRSPAPSEEQSRRNPTAARAEELEASVARNREQLTKIEAALKEREARARDLEAKAQAAEKAGKPTEAAALRQQAAALHSPPIPHRDDLQRLPDDQGPGRRAGLRRDRGRPTRTPASRPIATSSRSASTTPTSRSIPARVPGRLARRRSRSRSAASARRSTSAWPRATSTSWPTRATSARTS